MKAGRTYQEHLEDAILDVLADDRPRNTAEINKAVRLKVPPLPADEERANERANETKYDQIVSNALQSGRRLRAAGLIERAAHGVFHITTDGKEEHARTVQLLTSMSETLDDLYPGGLG